MVLQVSEAGLRLIELFESFRSAPYPDGRGIWTVAWGHVLRDPAGGAITNAQPNHAALVAHAMQMLFGAQTCTKDQGDRILLQDLADAENAVAHSCPVATQSQFDAMVSMVFNIGAGNFSTSSVKRFHNGGNNTYGPVNLSTEANYSQRHAAPFDMPSAFASWSESAHEWVLGLFRRRMVEAMVYRGDDLDASWAAVERFNA